MLRRSTSTHACASALMLRACGLPSTTLEPEERRRAEQELWGTFEVERPCILGALLDSVVKGPTRSDLRRYAIVTGRGKYDLSAAFRGALGSWGVLGRYPHERHVIFLEWIHGEIVTRTDRAQVLLRA